MRRIEGGSRLISTIKGLPEKIGRSLLPSQPKRQLAADGVTGDLNDVPRFEDENPKTAHRLNLKIRREKAPTTEEATTALPKKDPITRFLDDQAIFTENSVAIADAPARTRTRPTDLPIPTEEVEEQATPVTIQDRPAKVAIPKPLRIGTKTRIALAILAAEGTGAVINEQFNDQPVSTASVVQDLAWPWNLGKSATEDIQGMFNRNKITETVFDNSASKGTLSGENTIIVSNLENLQGINTISQSSEDGHAVNILIPLQGMPPSGKVEYSRELVGKNSNNPIYASEPRQYALENGIENKIVLKNIPAGYTILAPVDGEFVYDRIRSNTPEGTIDGPTFFFKDEKDILYQIAIFDASGNTLAPILDVPFRTMKDARDDHRKFLHPIKKGEPIATLLQQGDIDIVAQAWPSGQSGLEEVSPGNVKYVYPININFITHLDPSTGEQKLVISK